MFPRRWIAASRIMSLPEFVDAPGPEVVYNVGKLMSTAFHRAVWKHHLGAVKEVRGSALGHGVRTCLRARQGSDSAPARG